MQRVPLNVAKAPGMGKGVGWGARAWPAASLTPPPPPPRLCSWKNRFFVLNDDNRRLTYFEKPGGQEKARYTTPHNRARAPRACSVRGAARRSRASAATRAPLGVHRPVRRPLLTPQANSGSPYRCSRST